MNNREMYAGNRMNLLTNRSGEYGKESRKDLESWLEQLGGGGCHILKWTKPEKELIRGGRGVRTWFGSRERVKFGMAFGEDQCCMLM